jgi:branched-chain amino acid aminotransferase
VPESEAKVSIYDSAMMFGDTVFEMTRSFNQRQFMLAEHVRRLYASAKWLHIDVPLSETKMIDAVNATISENSSALAEDDEHRIMINVTRGTLGIYESIAGIRPGPNVIIADFPLRWTVRGMGKLFDEGIDAVVPSQRAIPARLLEPKAKTRSRMHLMMANIQASLFKGRNVWPLLLDDDGYVAEGTGDNFFIVRGGRVITPEPRNCLRGISRAYVLALANSIGLRCEERNIEPYDVVEADEAFMTGTPFCMLPVVTLDGMRIGSGYPGDTTMRLLNTWSQRVSVDIKKQIQEWDITSTPLTGPTPYTFKR